MINHTCKAWVLVWRERTFFQRRGRRGDYQLSEANPAELRTQLGRNLTYGLLDALGRSIVIGKYDTRAFPTEAELAKQHGVSRSVTREAVKMLTAKGLLSARPRQGTIVQPSTSWNLFDPDVLRWLLERKFSVQLLKHFNQLRVAIEPAAAALAATNADPGDLEAIKRQFSHLLRIVPGDGLVVHNAADANLQDVRARGCWTPQEGFAQAGAPGAAWSARLPGVDHARFEVLLDGACCGIVEWNMLGAHNVDNALAAIAAARHAGVPVATAIEALGSFRGIRRRMELTGEAAGIRIHDDFAHHPTAIATTIDGLRRNIGTARLVAVLEARSNTMRMGVHKDTLAASLRGADAVYLFAPPDLGWDASAVAGQLGSHAATEPSVDALLARLERDLRTGDHVLVMSNGGFGGLHQRLLGALQART